MKYTLFGVFDVLWCYFSALPLFIFRLCDRQWKLIKLIEGEEIPLVEGIVVVWRNFLKILCEA